MAAYGDALEIVRLRNQFYRTIYRRLIAVNVVCCLVIVSLLGMIAYQSSHQPTPRYIPTDAYGKLIPLVPLSKPNQTDAAVMKWASQAVVAAYSMDYVNYKGQLQFASQFFTQRGWKSFVRKLIQSNNLKAVSVRHLLQHAVATEQPRVIKRSIINGVYTWQIAMPLLVVLEGADDNIQQPLTVTVHVRRVIALDNPKGIQISQFVSAPRVG